MKFCPDCGNKLQQTKGDKKHCVCGYIDWDNCVNIGVVTVAFNDNNEFLTVVLDGQEEGKITFPGGYRDLGESLEEAAHREFMEETGYQISNLKLFNTYTYDEKRIVWITYLAMLDEGLFIKNNEVKAINMYTVENPPTDKLRGPLTERLLQDIVEYIQEQKII